MQRALLRLGDKAANGALVTEGYDGWTHHGIPLTFIGARTWCSACDSEGTVDWKGQHHPATMNGKQQALDGDICLCLCSPPPVFSASHDSAWHTFELPNDFARMDYDSFNEPITHTSTLALVYDECVVLVDADTRSPMANVLYRFMSGRQVVAEGRTDGSGRTKRVSKNQAETLQFYIRECEKHG